MLWNDSLEEGHWIGLELLNEKALKSLEFCRTSGARTLYYGLRLDMTRHLWCLSNGQDNLAKPVSECLVSIVNFVRVRMIETWTLTQTDRRLVAFEMWIWRRMEMISWLDKVTNEEVLRRQANTELCLIKETSMDLPCFETRWPFAWYYWRKNER